MFTIVSSESEDPFTNLMRTILKITIFLTVSDGGNDRKSWNIQKKCSRKNPRLMMRRGGSHHRASHRLSFTANKTENYP
jgi:hypothetical protein